MVHGSDFFSFLHTCSLGFSLEVVVVLKACFKHGDEDSDIRRSRSFHSMIWALLSMKRWSSLSWVDDSSWRFSSSTPFMHIFVWKLHFYLIIVISTHFILVRTRHITCVRHYWKTKNQEESISEEHTRKAVKRGKRLRQTFFLSVAKTLMVRALAIEFRCRRGSATGVCSVMWVRNFCASSFSSRCLFRLTHWSLLLSSFLSPRCLLFSPSIEWEVTSVPVVNRQKSARRFSGIKCFFSMVSSPGHYWNLLEKQKLIRVTGKQSGSKTITNQCSQLDTMVLFSWR